MQECLVVLARSVQVLEQSKKARAIESEKCGLNVDPGWRSTFLVGHDQELSMMVLRDNFQVLSVQNTHNPPENRLPVPVCLMFGVGGEVGSNRAMTASPPKAALLLQRSELRVWARTGLISAANSITTRSPRRRERAAEVARCAPAFSLSGSNLESRKQPQGGHDRHQSYADDCSMSPRCKSFQVWWLCPKSFVSPP